MVATPLRAGTGSASAPPRSSSEAPRLPGLLFGVGLGGFLDGIVMHQILQWHHLLTDEGDTPMTTLKGLEDNTVADGLFHLATWGFVVAGMTTMLNAWQRGRLAPPWRTHIGLLLIGFAAFNLVEGLVDHQLLGIHHVRDDLGGPLSWDVGFLVVSAVIGLLGAGLLRSGRHRDDENRAPGR